MSEQGLVFSIFHPGLKKKIKNILNFNASKWTLDDNSEIVRFLYHMAIGQWGLFLRQEYNLHLCQ